MSEHLSARDVARLLRVSKSTALAVMREAGAWRHGRIVRVSERELNLWRLAQAGIVDPAWVDEPCVYFIQCGERIKIGHTRNLSRRITDLKQGAPDDLYVLLALAGGAELERKLHARFSGLRRCGEWFDIGSDLVEFILNEKRETECPF